MKLIILLSLFLLSFPSVVLAEELAIKKVMTSYLEAIKKKDANAVAKVVTDKYYKILNQEDQLQEMFNLQSDDQKPIDVDIQVKKVTTEDNMFLVNFKDKQSKSYSHHWYVIIKENKNWKIDSERMLEESKD